MNLTMPSMHSAVNEQTTEHNLQTYTACQCRLLVVSISLPAHYTKYQSSATSIIMRDSIYVRLPSVS